MSNNVTNELTLTTNITYKDYLKFSIYHPRKVLLLFFIGFFFVFFIIHGYASIPDLFLQFIYVRYGNMAGILLFDAFKAALTSGSLVFIAIFFIWLRVRKEYKSDRLIRSDISYTINREGINQKRGKSNMYIEWKDVYKVFEKRICF
ncbi:hypothetical protein [Oceanobacillus jeddahense]|uniref:Poly-beta-1,6-N-acetyl-D-glucosamine biosynthesis protein PgaD n=1 Tax=Oceanobacillus jeddahense TaxID=1462527 RepID=A0ABY5JXL3_9BACI|nr:hypothetical protein [Oceanobacillus jeddahense]UUI04182.1 hypothetical protein NP439_05765 [Oceanobacillus jeddahense]